MPTPTVRLPSTAAGMFDLIRKRLPKVACSYDAPEERTLRTRYKTEKPDLFPVLFETPACMPGSRYNGFTTGKFLLFVARHGDAKQGGKEHYFLRAGPFKHVDVHADLASKMIDELKTRLAEYDFPLKVTQDDFLPSVMPRVFYEREIEGKPFVIEIVGGGEFTLDKRENKVKLTEESKGFPAKDLSQQKIREIAKRLLLENMTAPKNAVSKARYSGGVTYPGDVTA